MKTEKLSIKIWCEKRTFLQILLKIESLHNWQSRAVNRYGLSTYEVCLKCGNAIQRNKLNEYPTFIESERLKEFDDQFDKHGKYIFNDYKSKS